MDGIVGPKTKAALYAGSAPSPTPKPAPTSSKLAAVLKAARSQIGVVRLSPLTSLHGEALPLWWFILTEWCGLVDARLLTRRTRRCSQPYVWGGGHKATPGKSTGTF